MGLARLAAAVVLTAILAAPRVWGQDEASELKKELKLAKDGGKKENRDDGAIDKKLLACAKDEKCKELLLKKKMKVKPKPKPSKPGVPASVEEALGDPSAAPADSAEAVAEEGSASSAPTEARSESVRQDAEVRSERTMRRAAGAAETLRRSLRPAEADSPTANQSGPITPTANQSGPITPAANHSGSITPPANRSVADMALAARSGYAAAFVEQGLKVGAGPRGEPAIQRLDGTPATAPELARLSAALSAEPAALMRRPDFYEVLPREKFSELKRDYAGKPDLRSTAFKDIALTERGRDFRWSASCSGLSGNCNPAASAGSYLKGRDVPPEDLKEVWKATHEEIGEAEGEFGEYSDEDRRLAEAEDLAEEKLSTGRRLPKNLSALLARMGDMARILGGGDETGGSASASAGAAWGGSAAVPVPAGRQAVAGEAAAAAAAGSAKPAGARLGPPEANQPPAPLRRRTADRWTWLYIVAGAGGGLALAFFRYRDRR